MGFIVELLIVGAIQSAISIGSSYLSSPFLRTSETVDMYFFINVTYLSLSAAVQQRFRVRDPGVSTEFVEKERREV